MNCRFFNAGKQWAFVILTLLGVSLAACGGGGGGGSASTPVTIPAAPSNLQATAASSSAINLTWTDASNNEDGFRVYRGTTSTTATDCVATLGVGATSYSNTGLAAATTYYYKVTAYNSAGESPASSVASAITSPPAAPSNLVATAASSSAINLTWADASSNEDGFRVYRGATSTTVTDCVATLGAGSTSYQNAGLAAGTTYYYEVAAFNAVGESASSNVANATTDPPPLTVPATPTTLQATAASGAINLAWIDASSNEEGFRVYRGATSATVTTLVATLGAGATGYLNYGLVAGTNYYYAVTAFNAAGESPASNVASGTPLLGPISVGGGNRHSLALMNNGTVRAWGSNTDGALGVGAPTDNSLVPIAIGGLTGVSAISAGDGLSLALMNDGTMKGWGENFFGATGSGDNVTPVYTPVNVVNLTNVKAISAGGYYSIAVKNDGTVWAWGSGEWGQLGDGTVNIARLLPVQVLTGVSAISASQDHTLALKDDGTVWAWGKGLGGMIGDGSAVDRLTPVQVVGLTGVSAISAGEVHSLALLSDGTVRAWGNNDSGQLGDGSTSNRLTPVQVSGLSNVLAISAGGHFSVALKSDGTVWAWGSGQNGRIGDGSTTNRLTPVQASGLTNVLAISAAQDHTLALKNDGTVWAWGFNGFGQVGDDTTIDALTPVPVSGF